ncbi:MAG: type IV pilus secretin PilQ [Myxococcota bacterium]
MLPQTTPLAGSLAALFASVPSGSQTTMLEHVETARDGDVRTIHIKTTRPIEYSISRLDEPERIIIDAENLAAAEPLPELDIRDGIVRRVWTEARPEGALRIAVELSSPRDYRVVEKGKELVLRIEGPSAAPASLGAMKLDVAGSRPMLVAPLNGTIGPDAVHIEALRDPPRLVVDLDRASIEPPFQRVSVEKLGVVRARIAQKSGSVRVVLDLHTEPPRVEVDTVRNTLRILLSAPPTARPSSSASTRDSGGAPAADPEPDRALSSVPPAPEAEPASPPPEPTQTAVRHAVTDIRFEPRDGFVRFTVEMNGSDFEIMEAGTKAAPRLVLPAARLPKRLERTLDVTEVSQGVLSGMSSYNGPGGVVLAVGLGEDTEHRHWRKENRLMWDFRPRTRTLSYAPESTAGYKSDMVEGLGRLTTGQRRYTGRRISLDLKDADIQNVLRLLADVSRLNIVASDDVQGKVTIKLRNVPWDQALDIILRSKQLDKVREGNIIRVAPLETLRREEELRLERQRAQVELEPLTVRLIPVSYAVANEIQAQVTALLSPRGKVNIDKRTNVLIVEDIADVLAKIERLVRTLDTQTPQVLIESRIVEASTSFSRELGIQWGGTVNFSNQFGNSTGLNFPDNIRISGGADDATNNVTEGVAANPQYAVNLPAAVGSGGGGALGLILGSVDGSALINLRLSAAEAVGRIKLVSAPKIVTMDNKEARILSGERVPITVITANGPTTRFIDANLELGVTPHVTQDGAILMQISAKKNELSDRVDFLGVPGIVTNEATTEMIVQDGDTAVLGGLYRRTNTENESYVPWIGRVPILGWLFKTTSRSDTRDEILIFISPRIVNRQSALVDPSGS